MDINQVYAILMETLKTVGRLSAGNIRAATGGADWSLPLQIGEDFWTVDIDLKSNGEPRFIMQSLMGIRNRPPRPSTVNLVAAPYLGPESRGMCKLADVNYLDFYGNVYLRLGAVYIERESAQTPEAAKKRLQNLFSPRSSRIHRIMLEQPKRTWLLKELAAATGVSLGQTHKTIEKLVDEAMAERGGQGVRLVRPTQLLDAWAQQYDYRRSSIQTYYSFTQDSSQLMRDIAGAAMADQLSYAFTMHAGASLVAPYVRFADVHLYTPDDSVKWIQALNLRVTEIGGNVHLMKPFDDGVMNPMMEVKGLRTVGKVQLYLDLLKYRSRGKEQADYLRTRLIEKEFEDDGA